MTRIVRVVTLANIDEITRAIRELPPGARVTLQPPRRTTAQNRLMWRMLACFADQVVHCGRRYPPETWKAILMHALGKTFDFAPSLDGDEVVALGYASSDLDKVEMSDMIELMYAEGTRLGVDFDADRREEGHGETRQSLET